MTIIIGSVLIATTLPNGEGEEPPIAGNNVFLYGGLVSRNESTVTYGGFDYNVTEGSWLLSNASIGETGSTNSTFEVFDWYGNVTEIYFNNTLAWSEDAGATLDYANTEVFNFTCMYTAGNYTNIEVSLYFVSYSIIWNVTYNDLDPVAYINDTSTVFNDFVNFTLSGEWEIPESFVGAEEYVSIEVDFETFAATLTEGAEPESAPSAFLYGGMFPYDSETVTYNGFDYDVSAGSWILSNVTAGVQGDDNVTYTIYTWEYSIDAVFFNNTMVWSGSQVINLAHGSEVFNISCLYPAGSYESIDVSIHIWAYSVAWNVTINDGEETEYLLLFDDLADFSANFTLTGSFNIPFSNIIYPAGLSIQVPFAEMIETLDAVIEYSE